MIKWKVSRADNSILTEIAYRAVAMANERGVEYLFRDALMDLTACHLNGCPLRLNDLLGADNFNFAHDVFGIRRNINRATGQLEGPFVPRFYDSAHEKAMAS